MNFLKVLLPPCNHCDIPSASLFCDRCFEDLKFSKACISCGKMDLYTKLRECAPCSIQLHPWKNLLVAFRYEGGVRDFILDFKDHNKPERLREIELKHLPQIQCSDYDFIAFAATDPVLNLRRVYDPTCLLAKRLGYLWKIPVFQNVFDRKPFLKSQKELGCETRRKFLAKTISLSREAEKLRGRRILFVDDVLTTGATLDIHVRLLRELTDFVDVFCLSRALKF